MTRKRAAAAESDILAQMSAIQREAAHVRAEATRRLLDLEARHAALSEQLVRELGHFDETAGAPALSQVTGASMLTGGMAHLAPRPAKPRTKVPPKKKIKRHLVQLAEYKDRSEHPVAKAIGNVRKFALERGVAVSSVRSWYDPSKNGRPVPRPWFNVLAKLYGLKESDFPHGVTDMLKTRKKKRRAGPLDPTRIDWTTGQPG